MQEFVQNVQTVHLNDHLYQTAFQEFQGPEIVRPERNPQAQDCVCVPAHKCLDHIMASR